MYSLKEEIKSMKGFLFLWLGQSISNFGTAMTSFAITIWIYKQTGSALSLSISGLAILLPKMLSGILIGPIVDRMDKKVVMIFADIGAGICTFILFLLLLANALEVWQIYCINLATGIFGSFQTAASDVAITLLAPREQYVRVNGLQSFSSGLTDILSPVFAAFLLGLIGMIGVIIFDFLTMIFACLTLTFLIKIPLVNVSENQLAFNLKSYILELKEGIAAVKNSKLLGILLLFFAFLNFVSGITYYNLLSPMILARTNNNATTLSIVNGAIGLGSVFGGVLVTIIPSNRSKVKTIFLCTIFSFVFGDLLFAFGKSWLVWIFAGFFSSVFIPAILANQSYFWRTVIPTELQGRAFSFRYAIGNGMLSIGMLLGGILADYVFEPFMKGSSMLLSKLLGNSAGSGMALMFLVTGSTGAIIGLMGLFNKSLHKAEIELAKTN